MKTPAESHDHVPGPGSGGNGISIVCAAGLLARDLRDGVFHHPFPSLSPAVRRLAENARTVGLEKHVLRASAEPLDPSEPSHRLYLQDLAEWLHLAPLPDPGRRRPDRAPSQSSKISIDCSRNRE